MRLCALNEETYFSIETFFWLGSSLLRNRKVLVMEHCLISDRIKISTIASLVNLFRGSAFKWYCKKKTLRTSYTLTQQFFWAQDIQRYTNTIVQEATTNIPKGQLISKCPFGVIKSSKKPTKFFSRISALASKKRSNQKRSVRESK